MLIFSFHVYVYMFTCMYAEYTCVCVYIHVCKCSVTVAHCVLQCVLQYVECVAVCCSGLQCAAVCCSVLQCASVSAIMSRVTRSASQRDTAKKRHNHTNTKAFNVEFQKAKQRQYSTALWPLQTACCSVCCWEIQRHSDTDTDTHIPEPSTLSFKSATKLIFNCSVTVARVRTCTLTSSPISPRLG